MKIFNYLVEIDIFSRKNLGVLVTFDGLVVQIIPRLAKTLHDTSLRRYFNGPVSVAPSVSKLQVLGNAMCF